MTEKRKNELDEMIEAGNIDALKEIKDYDEQKYVIQQTNSVMNGDKIKDEETKNNIIKDCVAHRGHIDAMKAWLGTYTDKYEKSYATHVLHMLNIFSTNDVEEMTMYLDEIKRLPRELLPKDILRRIDQLDKIKDMSAEEINEVIMSGIKTINTFIGNIRTVYEEYEIMFDIVKIAIDMHVYSDVGTILRTRLTTAEIEEAYAKNNK